MTQHPRPATLVPGTPGWPDLSAARALDLRALLHILWQHAWVLTFCFATAMGGAYVVLQKMPERYTASAEIMLNNRETNVVDMDSVVSDLGGHDVAANEQRVLTSQKLLQRVVDRLRLDRDPEFNRVLAPPSVIDSWRAEAEALLDGTMLAPLLARAPVLTDPELAREREALEVIETFREALQVAGVPYTRSITVSVTSTDPAKAALIANTLADLYIVDQLETKFEATRRASAWLSERIAELKTRVESSEAAVEAFKAEQAIGSGHGSDLTSQQIAELNSELIAARAARAEAEARYQQVKARADEGGIAAASKVVSSELILTLRTQLSDLARREAELNTRYGPRHPKIINVRAEIADIRSAIGGEVRKIIEGLRNDAGVAQAREAALAESLSELEDKSVALSRGSVQLRQLEREAAADRLIYENFLKRFRETTEQEDLQAADARLLSAASQPLSPSVPKTKKVLLIAAALGLFIGLGLVVLLETLNNTFRTVSEVGDETGLPVLAALPRHGRRRRRAAVLDYLAQKPNSALAEAVRTLRTALSLSNVDRPPRVVMVTSSLPGEGKSTTCLLLAQMSSQVGRRAIVVDCDIRRPSLSRVFDTARSPGLLAVLDGSATLEDAIVADAGAGFDVLPVARAFPQGADALTSERFREMVRTLAGRYGLVLLDTPPVLPVSDAASIGKLADATVYAVRWHSTPRAAVTQGIARLRDLGVGVTGCAVTLVDPRREARHANARHGYGPGYYAAQSGYYVN